MDSLSPQVCGFAANTASPEFLGGGRAKLILELCITRDTLQKMSASAIIHARIDAATKEVTERILHSLGLTPTEAIRLFYRQIALRGEFPLELRMPNRTTADTLTKADQGGEVEHFNAVDELFASWEK